MTLRSYETKPRGPKGPDDWCIIATSCQRVQPRRLQLPLQRSLLLFLFPLHLFFLLFLLLFFLFFFLLPLFPLLFPPRLFLSLFYPPPSTPHLFLLFIFLPHSKNLFPSFFSPPLPPILLSILLRLLSL